MRILSFIVTALIAGAFGVLAVFAVHDVTSAPAAGSASGTTPSASVPPQGGSRNLLPPGGAGGAIPSTGPGQTVHLQIGGKVTAVSATSITLGGRGQQVTAAVTGATVVTGSVHDIGGVKVGDMVSAQITGTGGKLTVAALQDPASLR